MTMTEEQILDDLRWRASHHIEYRGSLFPEVNLPDVMAVNRGWLPLRVEEEMTVTFGSKKYTVTRNA